MKYVEVDESVENDKEEDDEDGDEDGDDEVDDKLDDDVEMNDGTSIGKPLPLKFGPPAKKANTNIPSAGRDQHSLVVAGPSKPPPPKKLLKNRKAVGYSDSDREKMVGQASRSLTLKHIEKGSGRPDGKKPDPAVVMKYFQLSQKWTDLS